MASQKKTWTNMKKTTSHGMVCRCSFLEALVHGIGGFGIGRLIRKGKANQVTFAGVAGVLGEVCWTERGVLLWWVPC